MRLTRARVQNYRSIKDSGWFEIERDKSILVGPNEAGKTALLKALEHIKAGPVVKALDPLRDYPRSEYHRIQSGEFAISSINVAEAEYELDGEDRLAIRAIAPTYEQCRYYRNVTMDNTTHDGLRDAPPVPTIGSTKDGLRRLAVQADARVPSAAEGTTPPDKPSIQLNSILSSLTDNQQIRGDSAVKLKNWLDTVAAPYLDGNDTEQQQELRTLRAQVNSAEAYDQVLSTLQGRCPVMVYFSTYTRVTPTLHLGHLADMLDRGDIDPTDTYNFGNSCLLKLLNFSARELSNLGKAPEPTVGDEAGWQQYRAQLDERFYRLNAASLNLTDQIRAVWAPSSDDNDYIISITADQQYLKVSVGDSTGAQVEIDQRSEGFQWLVSFFIVFFAQTSGALKNSILLLDEPGLSLHGLKQREFRTTLSRLAEANQLMFTTHSPFLVGPDELQLVRVVEMVDRQEGTKVHTEVVANDPASLLPLQEALGYDLAQSLFAQQRNLVLEGLTDYWYIDATAALLRAAGVVDLNEKIALVPAASAGKVVYFATILHAHNLKVAALLDSDAAGDQAAAQETLVHTLGNKRILRTRDSYSGPVAHVEIEDLLRETLVAIGKTDLGWDVEQEAVARPTQPIVDVFSTVIGSGFSKYKLAKAYLRWTQSHEAGDLKTNERTTWQDLIEKINQALK